MTIKILSIGNSFSTDATAYLHQLSSYVNIDTLIANLYIGGCSLETHWRNIKQNNKYYLYEKNGLSTEKKVSIKYMLEKYKWDFITLQQASHYSGLAETYQPYIQNIHKYIKNKRPESEIVIHQTWAYEKDCKHEGFIKYNNSQKQMFQNLNDVYKNICKSLNLRLIPSGSVIQYVRTKEPFIYENGGISLCRDGFHMNMFYGRYLLAATWFEFLLKGNILKNSFIPPIDSSINKQESKTAIQIIKNCVHKIISNQKNE